MKACRLTAWALAGSVAAVSLLARGGGGCVAAGTLIDTPAGAVCVEQLRIGDAVWSWRNGQPVAATVQAVSAVDADELIEITAEGHSLRVTPEHPIQTAPGVFVRADRLDARAVLFARDGDVAVGALARTRTSERAYNLLVSPGGVFFANGIIVHNKGCFLPATPITMADGSRRPISDVRPGDFVLAFAADGSVLPARVAGVLTHQVASYLVVRTDQVELHVTEEHPFYVSPDTFKTIESLRVGETIFAYDGARSVAPQRLLALERVRQPTTVYDLQVDEPRTFFANGVAVHNKGGGCFAPGTLIATPAGPRAIETLGPGDTVLAPEPDGRPGEAEVLGVYLNFAPSLALHTDRGTLRTTDEHPLRRVDGAFTRAGQFRVGTPLTLADGGGAAIRAIARSAEVGPVYNLSVAGPHTFVADGFVVHNKGGGGSHSRGSRGGSGSGGGDAGAALAFIGVVAVVCVLYGWLKGKGNTADEDLDYCFSRSAVDGKAGKTIELLNFIARVDDSFTPARLQQVARDTFLKLQECWQAREYAPMEPLLMRDLYEQHGAQLRGMKQTHEVNKLEAVRVEAVDLVHVRYTEKQADRVFAALITAWIRDYYVDDRSGAFLRGDAAPARFQEFWVFQFWAGAWRLREIEQTRESDLLKEENFFEQFTDTGRDQIYGATAGTSGPAGPNLPPVIEAKADRIDRLLNFLVQTDRIWDREAMLAAARRLYSGVLLAWQDGRPDAFTGLDALPDTLAHLRAVNEANQRNGWRVEYRNLCVRKVEIVHVNNRDDRSRDEFTARISAHAQTIVTRGGAVVHRDDYVKPWVEFWTFGRANKAWQLKEILPAEKGAARVALENTDEGSAPGMLQWYYSKTRAT